MTAGAAVLVARTLGPAGFGLFSAFFGLAMVATRFADAGLATWILAEVSKLIAYEPSLQARRDNSGAMLSAALVAEAALFMVIVLFSTVVLIALSAPSAVAITCLGLLSYMFLVTAASAVEVIYRAHRLYGVVLATNIGEKALLLSLLGASIAMDLGVTGIVLAYGAAGAVRLLVNLTVSRRRGLCTLFVPDRSVVVWVVRSSWPLGVTSLALSLRRLDVAVVATTSSAAAGLFAVGDRLTSVITALPNSAASALYPVLAAHSDAVSATRRASVALAILGAVVAAVGIACAPWVVPLLFGSDYSGATAIVQIMLAAMPFAFAVSSLTTGLVMARQYHRANGVILPAMIGGLCMLPVGYWLYGAKGAAAVFVLRWLWLGTALWLSVRRYCEAADAKDGLS